MNNLDNYDAARLTANDANSIEDGSPDHSEDENDNPNDTAIDTTREVFIKGHRIPPETLQILTQMNELHAFVAFGGKTRYLDKIPEPSAYEPPYQFMDKQTFEGFYDSHPDINLLARRRNDNTNNYEWIPIGKSLIWAWKHWPERRQYRRVGFHPVQPPPPEVFNLWEGWACEPRKGCWKKLRKHIYEVVCNRDPQKFRWLIGWLAHVFQTTGNHQKRLPTSPVIWGVKGGGKSLCFDLIADCFGNHGMTVSRKEQLIGKFNRHLMMSLFVVAEEAVYAFDKAGEGPLKDLLTRKSLTIEPKNVDSFNAPNYCRFVFVSNDSLAVPMTTDERRYQPFEISSHRVGDRMWFEGIVEEMRNGGIEAMMFDLMHHKFDEKLIRSPLQDNQDLEQMKALTLSPVERFIIEWAVTGGVRLSQVPARPLNAELRCFPSTKAARNGKSASANVGGRGEVWDEQDLTRLKLRKKGDNFIDGHNLKEMYDEWRSQNTNRYDNERGKMSMTGLLNEIESKIECATLFKSGNVRGLKLPSRSVLIEELKRHSTYEHIINLELHTEPD